MDDKIRRRVQLNCLYDMFRDRIEEDVIYIVYTENQGMIDATIDQLVSIASCAFTGHHFDTQPLATQTSNKPNFSGTTQVKRVRIKSPAVEQVNGTAVASSKSDRESPTEHENTDNAELDIEESLSRLQKSIDDLLLEKDSCCDKASKYRSKKMYPVTSYYSELGTQIRKMIEEKTNELVELLLQKSSNSDSIDLHGLNPIQARLVVSELLKIRQGKLMIDKQGEASIDIITGWGKHSLTHGQRVKPTIVALLREKGFEYHRLNRGALRVTIRK